MSYRSQNKLPLSEKPLSSDPEIFPDLNDMYNSIHLLNDWVTRVQEGLNSGETQVDPDKAIPFRNWFWAVAGEPFPSGTIVTPLKAGRYLDEDGDAVHIIDGYYKGCGGTNINAYDRNFPNKYWSNGMYGIALDEAVNPGDSIRVAIGPGVLNVPDVLIGDILYCFPAIKAEVPDPSFANNQGQFQTNRGGITTKAYLDALPIAHVIANGYVLFGYTVDDYLYRINKTLPPEPDTP